MKRNAKIESKNKVLKNPSKKESDGIVKVWEWDDEL